MMDVWIINGIPGAGKSTTARALAQQYPRGVHIEGDRLQECIVSGAVWPGEHPLAEERRQIHLNVRHQCLLARSFAQEGFTPVLDYVVVHRARVQEYRQQLPGLVLRLVTLAPGVQVALARDQQRPEKTVAPQWTHLDAHIRAALQHMGLWVDNSCLTIAETVAHIWSHREEARV
jgi:predicted kinase